MGARKADYLAAAPPDSFIHVDDFTDPMDLAAYLHRLNRDDSLYSQYFRWKGSGSFVNTKFWCRLCAMAHDDAKPVTWYDDVETWWRGNGTCTRHRWDRRSDLIHDWNEFMLDM